MSSPPAPKKVIEEDSGDEWTRFSILVDSGTDTREKIANLACDVLDRVETDWPFRIQLPVGTSVPFHCTASGKCFMASLSAKARWRFVMSLSLEPLTQTTRTDPMVLLEELETIAGRGYSLDDEEFMEGMVAIAVPVTDLSGRFVAALAFHAPTQRVSIDDAIARKDVLQTAAERLSHALSMAE